MMNRIIKITSLLVLLNIASCSSYKNSWDCPRVRGIGCSSVEYADLVAKEQIVLNKIETANKYGEKIIILDRDRPKEMEGK